MPDHDPTPRPGRPRTRAPTGTNELIGVLVRYHRFAVGLSQEDLAQQTGLSWHAISRIERGESRLTLEDAAKIAVALRCKVKDFLPSS